MYKSKKGQKLAIVTMLSVSLLSFSLIPTSVYATSPAVVAILGQIWHWAQTTMMDEEKQMTQSQTDQLKNKASAIFKKKTDWEQWPSSLKSLFVENAVKLENKGNKMTYDNAQSFLSYTQGKASGVDASKNPAKAVFSFRRSYGDVQKMNPDCKLDVPTVVGDSSNNCTPTQKKFTNFLITGVHPMPSYPKDATNTAIGQQYAVETLEYKTRTALTQIALAKTTSDSTTKFINGMQKSLQNPTPDQINNESSEAVARDALIVQQERAIIQLKQYQAELMNQRLLATMVAQNEEIHLKRIHELARHIH